MTLEERRAKGREKQRRWREAHPESPGDSAERRRQYYAANRERLAAQARARYAADPERHRAWMREDRVKDPAKYNARQRAWRAANPDKVRDGKRRERAASRARYPFNAVLRKHGITLEEWVTLWDAQAGQCYLCRRPMSKDLMSKDGAVIDHDHSCCGPRKSCRFCRRGLACRLCNIVIGGAHDDPGRLRLIADNLEAAMRAAAERPARRPIALPLWDEGSDIETAPA